MQSDRRRRLRQVLHVVAMLMVLLGMMGFATAVLVRPATRHAAVAAGLAVGFISAIVAFALSLGWGPLVAKTLLPIRDDLYVMSEAAFTRSATGQPHPSDRLLAKYPDLEKAPVWNRGNLIAGKMMGDLLVGLMRASRLIRPGRANCNATIEARERCSLLTDHSAWRVCTTMNQRPSTVKLSGANAR